MIQFFKTLFGCPVALFSGIAGVSIFALAAALYSEVALGLEPCPLCIYQRVPFLIGAVLGIVGLFLRDKPDVVKIITGLLGLNFLANAGIAFYHTGVEQKWWASSVEGCSTPNFADMAAQSTQSILENIMSAPTGNCAEIPWADPIIGLSMANYNILLCLGIFAICVLSILTRRKNGPDCVVKSMDCP